MGGVLYVEMFVKTSSCIICAPRVDMKGLKSGDSFSRAILNVNRNPRSICDTVLEFLRSNTPDIVISEESRKGRK